MHAIENNSTVNEIEVGDNEEVPRSSNSVTTTDEIRKGLTKKGVPRLRNSYDEPLVKRKKLKLIEKKIKHAIRLNNACRIKCNSKISNT